MEKKLIFLNAKKLANDGLKDILISKESLFGKFLHKDVKVNDEEGNTFKIGTELNDTIIRKNFRGRYKFNSNFNYKFNK